MTLLDFGKKYLDELKSNQTDFKAHELAMRINKIVYVQTVKPLTTEDKLKIIDAMEQGTTDVNVLKYIEIIKGLVR